MKNYNFMGFYFGKERCHLQSEVKRNYVMALKMTPKMALKVAPKMILKMILKWYPRINNLQKYDQMVMKEMKSQGKSFGTETNPRQQGEQTWQKMSVSKPAESEKYSYPLKRNEFMLVT